MQRPSGLVQSVRITRVHVQLEGSSAQGREVLVGFHDEDAEELDSLTVIGLGGRIGSWRWLRRPIEAGCRGKIECVGSVRAERVALDGRIREEAVDGASPSGGMPRLACLVA